MQSVLDLPDNFKTSFNRFVRSKKILFWSRPLAVPTAESARIQVFSRSPGTRFSENRT